MFTVYLWEFGSGKDGPEDVLHLVRDESGGPNQRVVALLKLYPIFSMGSFFVVVARFAYYVIKSAIESTNDGMFYISWHTVSLFQDAVIRILFYVVEFGI